MGKKDTVFRGMLIREFRLEINLRTENCEEKNFVENLKQRSLRNVLILQVRLQVKAIYNATFC
jgi:hypothetical protein